ncbi:MAG: Maf family protein [Alicyclobacillus herbarius]|uniref:Maf family protein n=1 Tax=Alicyclobacillus herbarius TaxID=122960 RepID=UPI000424B05F|nr:Maf family protein [Alicyclobacillus herbarius]MCL6632798.1 Maf family protein [Alicyclobacillus herbarius]
MHAQTNARPRLILASSSPRRRDLLAMFKQPFEVIPNHANETVPGNPSPDQLVQILAERKAEATLKQQVDTGLPDRPLYIIGADTVVSINGEILGKPRKQADAFDMLTRLQGRSHDVFSGLCVLRRTVDGAVEKRLGYSQTRVDMAALTPSQIQAYIATGEPLDKAGSYGIQGFGSLFIPKLEGDYFTVVGLPVFLLGQFLLDLGYPLLPDLDGLPLDNPLDRE